MNVQTRLIHPDERPWWRRLPSLCAVCHGWGSSRVCGTCVSRFAPHTDRCLRCAATLTARVELCGDCIRNPPPFDSALAAVDYGHPWDRLIREFKFSDSPELAGPLAELLIAAHRRRTDVPPDLLLPVPLGSGRLKERGYNQSWEIARRCAHRLGCRTDATLLLRIKDTPHQLSLPREHRKRNVQGAFAIEPTRRDALRGRKVTLVDDVMTTQATAAELTQVVRAAGAAAVHVWVVARTPAPGH